MNFGTLSTIAVIVGIASSGVTILLALILARVKAVHIKLEDYSLDQ
jgi:hypothetical protein